MFKNHREVSLEPTIKIVNNFSRVGKATIYKLYKNRQNKKNFPTKPLKRKLIEIENNYNDKQEDKFSLLTGKGSQKLIWL